VRVDDTPGHAPSDGTRPRRAAAARRGRRAVALTLASPLCAAALPSAAAGQGSASLAAGVASVRYADTLSVLAATVGPTLRYDSDRVSLLANGTYSRLTPESGLATWTSQGAVAASVLTPAVGPLRGELAGRGGMSAHQDGTRTGQWQALGRAHLMGASRGVWAGGGAGRTWDGVAWRDVRAADAGAWARRGAAMLVAVATPTSVSVPTGPAVRYTDVELSARWTAGRVELGGALGARAGDAATVTAGEERVWGSGTATVHLGGPVALVGSAGSYPVDFAQGFPGGRYVSLALGVAPRSRRTGRPAAAPSGAVDVAADGAAVTSFAVGRAPSGARRLRLRAPAAARVEVAGDFSAWAPVPLRRVGDGWWQADVAVPAGTHEIGVRVNGGAWRAPPGLVLIADELGGQVGLLVLP